jgi:hypothetical protein
MVRFGAVEFIPRRFFFAAEFVYQRGLCSFAGLSGWYALVDLEVNWQRFL